MGDRKDNRETGGAGVGSTEPEGIGVRIAARGGACRRTSALLAAAMAAACSLTFGTATALAADPGAAPEATATTQAPEATTNQAEGNASQPEANANETPSTDSQPAPEPAIPLAGDGADAATAAAAEPQASNAPVADAAADVAQSSAAAASTSQDKPTNEHVTVQTGTPGNTPAVEQQNEASAAATAGATAEVGSEVGSTDDGTQGSATEPDGATAGASTQPVVGQQADATATASQQSPSNTNVAVRVDSAGTNGPVSQGNVASSSAVATTTGETPANNASTAESSASGSSTGPTGSQGAANGSAQAIQTNPSNTNVSVRVGSPGDDGKVTQSNAAAASATGATQAAGGNPSATASQTGAANTNVSIRVASPGTTLPADQSSTTTTATSTTAPTSTGDGGTSSAATAPVTSIAGDGNTDLRVEVDGAGLADPLAGNGLFAVWIWKWTWTSTEDLASKLSSGAPVTDPGAWEWDVVSGDDAASSLGGPLARGDWIWKWNWNRPTWTWSFQPQAPLDCNCAWYWDWSWSWNLGTGGANAVSPTAAAPPAGANGAAVVQHNDANATAEASAGVTIEQTIAQDGSGEQFAGQIASVVQDVGAQADVVQTDARNRWWGLDPVVQGNNVDVLATAKADTDLTQAAAQFGDSAADAAQWSGQQAQVAQFASAGAFGRQAGATNSAATRNGLIVDSSAGTDVIAHQDVEQVVGGPGGRSQWAGQLIQIGQATGALAQGLQLGLVNDRFSRNASATAGASAEAVVLQGSAQKATGGGESSQTSAQLVVGFQDALAAAGTMQPTHAAVGSDGIARSSSRAFAVNGALVAEAVSQFTYGSGIQDAVQNALFAQSAFASSTSLGGIGGLATAWNCATITQAAGQAIGAGLPGPLLGSGAAYCDPRQPVPTGTLRAARPGPSVGATAAAFAEPTAYAAQAPVDVEQLPHATHGAYPGSAAASRAHWGTGARAHSTIFGAQPDAAAPFGAARVASIQVSSPSPAEGASALQPGTGGGGKPGVDPPSAPVSGTPAGPGSLIPGLGGGGGAAAIMAVLVLTLLGAWRTYGESAVRRPTLFGEVLTSPG